jgi:hypothetical protein
MPKPTITPVDAVGSRKTGMLPDTLTKEAIESVLGFPPNVADDADRVEHSWGFEVDGVRCGIWDYCGARWSVYDPKHLLPELVADAICEAQSDAAEARSKSCALSCILTAVEAAHG